MSNVQMSIRTDERTKQAIADFAASLGLSTSAFVTAVSLQAVRDRRLVLEPTLEPTPYLEKIMREADKDIKSGKNISKAYDNVDDFMRDLEKEASEA
jgi:antitoxin component of RelBE/YafQ-DinJ toxin-antitoxin module